MGFTDSLTDFFGLLFSRDPAGGRERRELRRIRQTLKAYKPALYRPAGQMLLPGFASNVFDAFTALKPYRDLFFRTVYLSDGRMARRYRDWLIECRLSGGERQLLAECNYEALLERAGKHPMPDEAIASAEADFQAAFKALEPQAARQFEVELADFDRFAELCRFDFVRLLKAFDPAGNPEANGYKPKFQAAEGQALVPELLDLYALLANLRVDQTVVFSAAALAERLGDGSAEEQRRKLQKAADRLNKILAGGLDCAVLAGLIRSLREQSGFAMPKPIVGTAGVAEYRDRLASRWRADKDRVQREIRERSLGADIAACFGEPPNGGLQNLGGISEELAGRALKECGRSFAWLTPLRLLKSIEVKLARSYWFDAARRLAIEGFFNNAIIRGRLTDAVGKLEKADARIAAFEESAGGQGRASGAALRRVLDESAKGKDQSDAAARIVQAIDERAKELVEQDVRSLREMAEAVYDIIADFRKPTPEILTNIRTLAAGKDKSLIPCLAQGYNDVAAFLKIMKAYLVVAPIAGREGEKAN
jgi:hypothetical protein